MLSVMALVIASFHCATAVSGPAYTLTGHASQETPTIQLYEQLFTLASLRAHDTGTLSVPELGAGRPAQLVEFKQGFGNPNPGVWEEESIERFLSDSPFSEEESERQIRTAIEYWIDHIQPTFVAADNEEHGNQKVLMYEAVDEFLEKNPRCCYFHTHDTEGFRPSFLSRWRHSFLGFVVINRYLEIRADGSASSILYGLRISIDKSGNVVEF